MLAMRAILEVRPDAIFIQSESSEYFHAESPKAINIRMSALALRKCLCETPSCRF